LNAAQASQINASAIAASVTASDNDRQQPVNGAHRTRLVILSLFEETPGVLEHGLAHDLRAVCPAFSGTHCPRYAPRLSDLTLVLRLYRFGLACCVPCPAFVL